MMATTSRAISLCISAFGFSLLLAADEPAKPVISRVKPAKETTRHTEPLHADGTVNYVRIINEHYARGVTPQNNAAVLLYEIMGPEPSRSKLDDEFFALLQMPRPGDDGFYFSDFTTWNQKQPERAPDVEINNGLETAMKRAWTKNDCPTLARWIDAMNPLLNRLVEACERPEYYSPLIVKSPKNGPRQSLAEATLPGVQDSQHLARALVMRGYRRWGEGSPQDAWKDFVAAQKLGRLIGRGPTSIENLVGYTIETMGLRGQMNLITGSKVARKLVAGLVKVRATLPARSPLGEKVNWTERFVLLDVTTLLANEQYSLQQLSDSYLLNELTAPMMKELHETENWQRDVNWNQVLSHLNEWTDRLVKVFEMPDRAARLKAQLQYLVDHRQQTEKCVARRKSVKANQGARSEQFTEHIADFTVALMLPPLAQFMNAETRIEQRDLLVELALALAAYHRDQNEYPDSLELLVPKYLPTQPQDLYRGQPLSYERLKDGYHAYSWGVNLRDDRGAGDGEGAGDDLSIRAPFTEGR